MESTSTFLYYLKRLSVVALLSLLPLSSWAETKYLVSNTLTGWKLYWGSYNSSAKTYDWTRCGNSATGGSGIEGKSDAISAMFQPDVDKWKSNTSLTDIVSDNWKYRFFINATGGITNYDPIFTQYTGNLSLNVVPSSDYANSFRLGSPSFSNSGSCYGAEYSSECYYYDWRRKTANTYNSTNLCPQGTDYKTCTSAEAASYDLLVTKENALLTIQYAYIAAGPNCSSGYGHDATSTPGACGPSFDIKVLIPVTTAGSETESFDGVTCVSCGSETYSSCNMSSDYDKYLINSGSYKDRGVYRTDWKKSTYDLSKYVGKKVRIYITNHDCLYGGTTPGGHFGYLYFVAKTEPLKLDVKYCSLDGDVTVTAPSGFPNYTWTGYQSNGAGDLGNLDGYKNGVHQIYHNPASALSKYVTIMCSMDTAKHDCRINIDTVFKPANVTPSFTANPTCDRYIDLADKTTYNFDGDSAKTREWVVFTAAYSKGKTASNLQNANMDTIKTDKYTKLTTDKALISYQFDTAGQIVRLNITNSMDCSKSYAAFVQPNPVATWSKMPVTACAGTVAHLMFTADTLHLYMSNDGITNLTPSLSFTFDNIGVSYKINNSINYITGDAGIDNLKYTVTDQFGCTYTGTYPVTVNALPGIHIMDKYLTDFTNTKSDNSGIYTFRVCPGANKTIQAYTGVPVTYISSLSTAYEVKKQTNSVYESKSEAYTKKNGYFMTAVDSTTGCSSTLNFNVDYFADSLSLTVPTPVCPFDTATVTVNNLMVGGTPTWWITADKKDSVSGDPAGSDGSSSYSYIYPKKSVTYYCKGASAHCTYTKAFSFKVNDIEKSSLSFSTSSKSTLNSVQGSGAHGHYYTLDSICSSDYLNISINNAGTSSAQYSYATSDSKTWVVKDKSASAVNLTNFQVGESKTLKIYIKTQPFDGDGNKLCISYDTVVVSGYSAIKVDELANDAAINSPNFCDGTQFTLKVSPRSENQSTAHPSDYSIYWTDANGGYTNRTRFEQPLTANISISKAPTAEIPGYYYDYTYTVTSNAGGCKASGSIRVYADPLPSFSLEAHPENVCSGGTVTLDVTDNNLSKVEGTDYYTYSNPKVANWKWSSTYTSDASVTSQTYTGTNMAGAYPVTGITALGCSTTVTATVADAAAPTMVVKMIPENGTYADAITFGDDGVSTKAVCPNTKYQFVVSEEGADYASSCSETIMPSVQRTSSPTEDVVFNGVTINSKEVISGPYNFSNNSSSNFATEFPLFTAQSNQSTSVRYDKYMITVNTPCGCSVTKQISVKVASMPNVNITATKSFICDNDESTAPVTLTASASSNNAGTIQYYWFKDGNPDLGDVSGSTISTTNTATATYEETNSVLYAVQVFDGTCYARASMPIYNQKAPTFTLAADPSSICDKTSSTQIKLSASSADSMAFSLRKADYTYGVSSLAYSPAYTYGSVNTVSQTISSKSYIATASGYIAVKAGNAQRYGENRVWSTSSKNFCYTVDSIQINTEKAPEISVQLFKDGSTIAQSDDSWSFCPDQKYYFQISNSNADASKNISYTIKVTDNNDPTISSSATVVGNHIATIENDGFVVSSSLSAMNYTFSITPTTGNTDCASTLTRNIAISSVPQLSIDVKGGMREGTSNVYRYCVDRYYILENNRADLNKDINFEGVQLSANIANATASDTYTYTWKRNNKGSFSIDPKNEATLVTSSTSSIIGYVSNIAAYNYDRTPDYNHDVSYSLQVFSAAGCPSNIDNIVVRTVDAPNMWADAFSTCMGGQAQYRVWEAESAVRISKSKLPEYSYGAYDTDSLTVLNSYGHGTTLDPTTSYNYESFYVDRTDNKGRLYNKNGVLVDDSVSYYRMYSDVKIDVGSELNKYFVFTKSDSLGCTSYMKVRHTLHQSPNQDSCLFSLLLDDGTSTGKTLPLTVKKYGTTTKEFISFSDLNSDDPEQVASVCPGQYLLLKVADLTNYEARRALSNPRAYNTQFRVALEVQGVGTYWSGWYTTADIASAQLFKPNCQIPTARTMRIYYYVSSGNSNLCYAESPLFTVGTTTSPTLTYNADPGCLYDDDGNYSGTVRFRALSTAKVDSDKHHYTWYQSDQTTKILGDDGKPLTDSIITYNTGLTSANLGAGITATWVYVYLADSVEELCPSSKIKCQTRLWQNPQTTLALDQKSVCEGDSILLTATPDYNYARGRWIYYNFSKTNNISYPGYYTNMYNDNAKRTTITSNNVAIYPHTFTNKFEITDPYQKIYFNAFYRTDDQNLVTPVTTTDKYHYCRTVDSFTVNALAIPNPRLVAKATEAEGKYLKDDIILAATSANNDSTGSRLICPGAEYYRQFSNLTPDSVTNFTNSTTTYKVWDVTAGTDSSTYTSTSTHLYTENVTPTLTADDHQYKMSAISSNGCQSPEVFFKLPLGKTPLISTSMAPSGVCAGSTDNTINLTATASNEGPFTYQWFTQSVLPSNKLTEASADLSTYTASPVTSSDKYVSTTVPFAVQVTNNSGCQAEASLSVKVNPLPQFTLTPSSTGACANSSVQITLAKSTGELNYGTDYPFAYSFNADDNKKLIGSSVSPVKTDYLTVSGDTRFYFKASVTTGSNLVCSDTASVLVPAYGIPAPTCEIIAEEASGKYAAQAVIPNNSLVCSGTKYKLRLTTTLLSTTTCTTDTFFIMDTEGNLLQRIKAPAGQSNSSIVFTATEARTFNYYVKNSCGCSSTLHSVSVGVAPTPVITIVGNSTFCLGSPTPITLSATCSVPMDYTWTSPKGETGASVEVTPLQKTNYSVSGVSTAYACPASATFTVDAIPVPSFTIKSSDTLLPAVCMGSKLTFTATSTEEDNIVSYAWADGLGTQKTAQYIASLEKDTVACTVTAKNGCTTTVKQAIIAAPLPTPVVKLFRHTNSSNNVEEITDGMNICYGDEYYPVVTNTAANQHASLDTYYISTSQAGLTTSGQYAMIPAVSGTEGNKNGEMLTYTMDGSKTYYLIDQTSLGCTSAVIEFSVNLAAQPSIYISSSTNSSNYCEGSTNSVKLIANTTGVPITTWAWQPPLEGHETDTVITIPAEHAEFTVYGWSADGCRDTANFKFTALPLPNIVIEVAKDKACINSVITLKAYDYYAGTANAGASIRAISWLATPYDESLPSQSSTGSSLTFALADTTSFRAIAQANNGCHSAPVYQVVSTVPYPDPAVVLYDVSTNKQLTSSSICPGTTIAPVFSNNGDFSNEIITYYWDDGLSTANTSHDVAFDGTSCNTSFDYQQVVNSNLAGTFWAYNETGCTSSKKSYTLPVSVVPSMHFSGSTSFCQGSTTPLTIKALPSATVKDVSWSPTPVASTADSLTIQVDPTVKTYTCYYTSDNDCNASASFSTTSKETPTVVLDGPEIVCDGSKAALTTTVTKSDTTTIVSYNWTPSVLSTSATANPTITKDASFYVSVTNNLGCASPKDSITVKVSPLPNPAVTLYRLSDHSTFVSGSSICPGEYFYPVFSNTATPLTEQEITYNYKSGTNAYEAKAYDGTQANSNYEQTFKNEGTTMSFTYSAVSSQGCKSSETKSFWVGSAVTPILSISGPETFCDGNKDSVTYNAISTNSVGIKSWSWALPVPVDQQDTSSIKVPPANSTYTVTGTSTDGCSATASKTLTMLPKPTITIDGPTSVCAGDYVDLTSTASAPTGYNIASYVWSTKDNATAIRPQVSKTTNYWAVALTNKNCVSDTAFHQVTAIDHPTIALTYDGVNGTSNICVGDNINVTASVGSSAGIFSWFSDAAHTIPLTEDGTLIKSISGTNNCTVTLTPEANISSTIYLLASLAGCSSDASATVKALPLPALALQGTTTLCTGYTLDLSVKNPVATTAYYWDGSQVANTNFSMPNITESTTKVVVRAVDANTCESEITVPITVNPSPILSLSADPAAVCPYFTSTITASGADSYIWHDATGTSTVGRQATYTTPKLTAATSYTVEGTITNTGCVSSATQQITVKTAPVLSLKSTLVDGAVRFCAGSNTLLEVSGAQSYDWTKNAAGSYTVQGANGQGALVSPSYSTTYTVLGSTDGCLDTILIPVVPQDVPTVDVVADNEGICSGNSVTLTCVVNGSRTQNADFTYSWSDDPTETSNTHTVTLTSNQTFTVKVRGTSTDCEASASKLIEVYKKPVAVLSSDLTTVCAGSQVNMTASATDGTPDYTYKWSRSSDASFVNTSATFSPTMTASDKFTLVVKDAHLCESNPVELSVFTQTLPVIKNIALTKYCSSDEIHITMSGAEQYNFGNHFSTKTDTSFTHSAGLVTTNVYGRSALNGSSTEFCQSKLLIVTDEIADAPLVEITSDKEGVCSGDEVTVSLSVGGTSTYEYSWVGYSDNKTNTITESLTHSSTFEAKVLDKISGCSTVVSKTIPVYDIPQIQASSDLYVSCADSSVNLSASVIGASSSDSYMFVWTRSDDAAYKVATNPVKATVSQNTKFTVVATDLTHSCSSAAATVDVAVQKNPVISNTAPTTYCSSNDVHLYLSGAEKFYLDKVALLGTDTTFSLPVGTRHFYVIGQDKLEGSSSKVCNSKQITVDVNVIAAPTVKLEGDSYVCAGSPLKVKANVTNVAEADKSSLTYVWSEGGTNNTDSLITYVSSAHDISVTVSQKTGTATCSTKVSQQYNVYTNPVLSVSVPEGDIVCNGSAALIETSVSPTSDAYNYLWKRTSDAKYSVTSNSITPVITKQDTFKVVVSDSHGCHSDTSSQIIRVQDKPVVTYVGTTTLCQGSTLTLTFAGAQTYYVDANDALNGNIYTEEMTTSRTHYYQVVGVDNISTSDATCASDPVTIPVTVQDNPVLTVTGSTTICKGSQLSLTAKGAASYSWSVADNDAADDVFTLTPSGNADGIYNYTVTGVSANACKATKQITVTTLNAPVFSVNASAAGICSDKQLTLWATPDKTEADSAKWVYTWDGGNLTGSTGKTVSTLVSGATTFNVTATNSYGCPGKQSIKIAQYDVPQIAILSALNSESYKVDTKYEDGDVVKLCANDKLRLYASPALNSTNISAYLWDNTVSAQNYFPGDTLSGRLTYTHTIKATTANGCTASREVNVEIQAIPDITLNADQSYCLNSDITLLARPAGLTYVWPNFNNESGDSKTTPASQVGTKTYTLYGYSSAGCKATATATVQILDLPAFSVDASTNFICEGESAVLTVTPDNPNSDYDYYWSNSDISQTIYPEPASAGVTPYTITVTDNNTNCEASASVDVTVNVRPTLSLATGVSTTACRGSELSLIAEGANEYYWTVNGEESGPYANNQTFITTPLVSATYTLAGLNKYAYPTHPEDTLICDATIKVPVTVIAAPSVQIIGNGLICYGDSVHLRAQGVDLTQTGSAYSWDNYPAAGETLDDKFTAENGQDVVYTVTGTSANGCSSTATKTVTMRPKTNILIKAQSPVCEGTIASAKVSSSDSIVSYRWNTNEMGDSIAHVISADVKYIVTATDANQCRISDSATIVMQKKLELQNISKTTSVCAGSNLALTVSGASSYIWENDSTKNTSSLIVVPTTDRIYTVKGTYGVCTASLSIPVSVVAAPVVSIQGDGSVCQGSTIVLYPYCDNNDVTYNWSGAATFTYGTDGSVSFAPKSQTKVTLTATSTDANACKGTATTTISVNNLPNVTMTGDVTPCVDSYTTLTASGASSYVWTMGSETVTSEDFSTYVSAADEDVTLWGVDDYGCENTIVRTIHPTARPVFTVDGQTICQNQTLQLSAINNETSCFYVWEGTDTTTTYTRTMNESGTYNISVMGELKSKAGCSTTIQVPVVVKALPELYITGNDYPCENTTMEVQAHGADAYVWSNNPQDTTTTGIYSREVTSPAKFSVQLTGIKDGCSADSVFTFAVHSSPLVSINGDNEACKDGIVTLTATSPDAATFDWGVNGAGATITPVITENTTFTVTVIDKNKCSGSASYKVTLVDSPTLHIYASEDNNANQAVSGGEVSVCAGNSLSFLATGARTWKWVNGLESSDSASYTPAATDNSQTISVTGYLGSCEATQVIAVTVLQKPNPWLDGATNVCEGDTVKLTAMGADHYEWSGITGVHGAAKDSVNYQLIYSPVEGSVKAIATNGCYTNVPFTLTFTKAPELNVAAATDVCAGAVDSMSVINPNADYVYVWNDNFSDSTFAYRSVVAGIDTVKVTAKVRSLGGCTTTRLYEVTTHALPYISYSADGEFVTVNADSSIQMCAGTDVTVVPLGAKHYQWTSEGLDSTANTMLLSPSTNSVYSITGTDEFGCSASRDFVVKVNASPVLYSTTYGSPDENGVINVAVCRNQSLDLNVSGAQSYTWFNGSTAQSVTVTPTDSRSYTVTGVKGSTSCPATLEYKVKVNELPDVLITDNSGASVRNSLCKDSRFVLFASGAAKYSWYDANNNVVSYKDSMVDYVNDTTTYSVVGVDSNKCSASSQFTVNAISTPVISFEPTAPSACAGASTTIYGRGSANNWWWVLNNDTVAQKSSLTVVPSADVTYTLYGSNRFGCVNSVDVPITVYTSPTIWIDGYGVNNGYSDTINACKYQDVTLSVMGDADSIQWPSGSTAKSITINDIQLSQTYLVTGIGKNGCATSIKIPVSVLPTAEIAISGDKYVCDSTSTILTVVADSGSFNNYYWSNNMLGTENQIVVTSDTTVSVTGYNSTTGCSNTAAYNIYVKALPVLSYQGETNICKGASSVIYATGANTYVWQDGSTKDAFVSKPQSDDIYKVIGSLNGCSDSLFIPITVKIAPVIWTDGLKPICQGDSLHLVAHGAVSYEWSTGVTSDTFSAAPLDSIAYTLTGTAANGCATTISVPVTVRLRPVVAIDGSSNVCLNSATDLTAVITSASTDSAGTGNAYRWYLNDNVVSTQSVLNYIITEPKTSFKLTGTDPAGCSNSTSITVTRLALPQLTVKGPDSICSGAVASFFANGATTFQWINGADTTFSSIFKAAPTSDAVYRLVGLSSMGCKSDTVITLGVNQLPDITISGSTDVCYGSSVSLIAQGASTYSWSNGVTGDSFTASPVGSSDYQVKGTDASGCSNTYTFHINVNPLPVFTINAQTGICSGDADTLTAVNEDAKGSYTYFWSDKSGSSLSGDTVAPVISQSTSYTVKAVNDSTLCESTDSIYIDAFSLPVLSYVGKDSICLGDTISIIAQGADTKSYIWSSNGTTISNDPMLKFSPSGSTQVILTGSVAKCSSSIRIPVTVVVPPYLYIAASADTICRGTNVTMLATGATSYLWQQISGSNTYETIDTTTSVTYSPLKSKLYHLVGTNDYGCVSAIDKAITVIDIPVVAISASKSYVCPDMIDSVSFTASSKNDIKKYTWLSEPYIGDVELYSNEEEFTAQWGLSDTTTWVYLSGLDAAGCVGTDSVKISQRPRRAIQFVVNPSCIDNDARSVRLTGSVPEVGTWTWSMGDGNTTTGQIATYEYAYPVADSFLVNVKAVDQFGCTYNGNDTVYKWRDFWAPEAFSPNNDGINDEFSFGGGDFIEEFHFVIYNRLGEIVFEGNSIDDKWDGTYKGQACPWGVYGYTATYNSGANSLSKSGKRKGYITIIR